MEITVLYFALLRDRAGSRMEILEVREGIRVADLREILQQRHPGLSAALGTAVYAINREFATTEDILEHGDEVAVFPPVSGGADEVPPTILALTEEPFDMDQVQRRLVAGSVGAVCMFTGVVRRDTSGENPHSTDSLQYEAYQQMALEKLEQVAAEIRSHWPEVYGIALIHRLGEFGPGEPTVLAACSAGHRDSGIFEAARFAIDRIKQIVPIWKQEHGSGGDQWVEGHYQPGVEDRRE